MIQTESSVKREVTQEILKLLIEKEIQTKDMDLIFNQVKELAGTTVIAPTNKEFLLPGEELLVSKRGNDC